MKERFGSTRHIPDEDSGDLIPIPLDEAIGDGSKVLIYSRGRNSYCAETATGKTVPLTGPGKDGAIAMLDDNTLLASCYPTTGTRVKFEGAWPVNGPAEVFALKLTRIDSQAFQTVVPYLEPGMDVSFGLGEHGPLKK